MDMGGPGPEPLSPLSELTDLLQTPLDSVQ